MNTSISSLTISLCDLELNLMVTAAKQCYETINEEDSALDEVAMDIGFDLGSRQIALTTTMHEALDNIRVLNESIYEAFKYAYNGSLRAN